MCIAAAESSARLCTKLALASLFVITMLLCSKLSGLLLKPPLDCVHCFFSLYPFFFVPYSGQSDTSRKSMNREHRACINTIQSDFYPNIFCTNWDRLPQADLEVGFHGQAKQLEDFYGQAKQLEDT